MSLLSRVSGGARRHGVLLAGLVLCLGLAGTTRPGHAAAAGATFSGTVAGSDQGFLTGASVIIDGPVHRDAKTDADGRFTIVDVPKGRYQVRVMADGYLPMERPMEVGDASVSVDVVLLRLPGL
ncbi:MAG: carboxypeptidase-like regulatory domain-containing protein [Vicinamibacterales bacterium]